MGERRFLLTDLLHDIYQGATLEPTTSRSFLKNPLKCSEPEDVFLNVSSLQEGMNRFASIGLDYAPSGVVKTIAFNTRPQPSFNKNFDLLIAHLKQSTSEAFS
ncbi:MAG: hypothetical protein RMJ53_07180 [Chitinophagales bacterium]|nr:hypothetical protein [Chitinophagales bacterium]